MDHHGSSLFDAAFVPKSPFVEAQLSFGKLLSDRPEDSGLRAVLRHFATDADVAADMTTRCRRNIMAMSAQIWHYFEVPFSSWPYRLLALVDERRRYEAAAVATEFWNDSLCNKDPWFSAKLMNIFDNAEQLRGDPCLLGSLQTWGKSAKLSNMHVERQLARMKKATQGKLPLAERLLSAGAVSEWVRTHVDRGGEDPRVLTKAQLSQSDAPLHSTRSRKTSMRGGLRPALHYMNGKMHEDALQGIRRAPAERRDRQRHLVAEYHEMAAIDQKIHEDAVAESRRAKRRCTGEAKETAELAARLDAAFCDYGLRLASKQSPVRLEVAENTIRQELGMDNAERLPGASAIWKAFKGQSVGALVCRRHRLLRYILFYCTSLLCQFRFRSLLGNSWRLDARLWFDVTLDSGRGLKSACCLSRCVCACS